MHPSLSKETILVFREKCMRSTCRRTGLHFKVYMNYFHQVGTDAKVLRLAGKMSISKKSTILAENH